MENSVRINQFSWKHKCTLKELQKINLKYLKLFTKTQTENYNQRLFTLCGLTDLSVQWLSNLNNASGPEISHYIMVVLWRNNEVIQVVHVQQQTTWSLYTFRLHYISFSLYKSYDRFFFRSMFMLKWFIRCL